MEKISITTRRYSTVFRQMLENYRSNVTIKIDGQIFHDADISDLLATWCTNQKIIGTHNFSLVQHDRCLFSFHDHPAELMIAPSERAFVERLVAEKVARMDIVSQAGQSSS